MNGGCATHGKGYETFVSVGDYVLYFQLFICTYAVDLVYPFG